MEEAANIIRNQIKHYDGYSSEQKLLFVYYKSVKSCNAAKSGRLAGGIAERQHRSGLRNSKRSTIGIPWKNKPTKSTGQRGGLKKDIRFIYLTFMMTTLKPRFLM
ncbi:uncharacterized protein BX663DRAFT_512272 [Cokeromyces recurvatus]|uniref:uncharacterized protein n=1 Tax=Cokeromyces recurvatus TaxID=90255 RepID=UPI00221F8834|nr:uncharacterized protein BX663DRAFT_512272 [Cokeromyces recurvatus]KAI7902254.1 hypothetical protein BX663DRAFT_512272 [Cokeromyces recurvatus]